MEAAVESVFVSYAGVDRTWAEWAAWHLREAGHRVELDVWDWRTGDNFVERMTEAMRRATTVVALLSKNYFNPERWTREEWTSIVARRGRLVPLTIGPLAAADMPEILSALIRKDLHGLDEPAAIAALLDAVSGPKSPLAAPSYPGASTTVRVPHESPDGQRPRLPSAAGMPEVWRVGPSNPKFTGRERLISDIREGLLHGRQVVTLYGLGGVGKSQIALEYAHRFATQYDIVWWIDAEQADQIRVRYAELADRLGIARSNAGAEHNVRALLERLRTQTGWLIILDNAGDASDFEGLIPTGPGHILITSRNPGWSASFHGLNVGVFTRSDSVAYLASLMPGISPEQADSLTDDLGDLPLALAQACGVITNGMTVDRYRRLLTDKTAKLMANGGPPGYPAPLAAAVDIATNRLATDHPDAANLLRLAAFLGPDPVPTEWLESVGDKLTTVAVDPDDIMWPQVSLQQLARYGLARVDYESFQIHRLTQAIIRDRSSEEETAAAQDDVIEILAAAAPSDPDAPEVWPQWAIFTSHVTARKVTAGNIPIMRGALLKAVRYLVRSGQLRAAMSQAHFLHDAWAVALGEDHPDTIRSGHFLGHAMTALGQYAEARSLEEDAFERYCRVLGADHADTLSCANDLAITVHNLGDYAEARRMDEDTFERRRRVLGEDHPDTLRSAQNLAAVIGSLGDYGEALRLDKDTLERRRRVLGVDHPETLNSAHSLASSLHGLGLYAQSRQMDEDTLERRRRVLGEDHPDTLDSMLSYAASLNAFGEHKRARRMIEEALERRRRLFGEDHPDTLHSVHSLAATLHSLQRYAEARAMDDDTRERRRRLYGPDHPDTLRSANSLAITLTALGQREDAYRLLDDTLERRRRLYGPDHPDTLHSAHNLATTLHNLRKYREARNLDEDTLERRRHLFGDDHPDVLRSQQSLAVTMTSLREHATAVTLLRDARTRSRRTLGDDHPLTVSITKSLVGALEASGKRHEAQKLSMAHKKAKQGTPRRKRRS